MTTTLVERKLVVFVANSSDLIRTGWSGQQLYNSAMNNMYHLMFEYILNWPDQLSRLFLWLSKVWFKVVSPGVGREFTNLRKQNWAIWRHLFLPQRARRFQERLKPGDKGGPAEAQSSFQPYSLISGRKRLNRRQDLQPDWSRSEAKTKSPAQTNLGAETLDPSTVFPTAGLPADGFKMRSNLIAKHKSQVSV